MSRRRVLVLAVPVLVFLIAVAVYLFWLDDSEAVRESWNARLAALRAAGEPIDPSEFLGDPVPDDDNAEGLLKEVHEAYYAEWPDWPSPTMLPIDDPDHGLTEEQRENLDSWWPTLEPMYLHLEEASRRPVLVSTSGDPLGITLIPWIQHAGLLWMLRAEYRPEDAERMAVQNLRVALAWRPRNEIEVMVRWGHFVGAIRLLHQAIASGRVDLGANGPTLDDLLARAESGWLADRRLALRAQRACVVRYVDWCSGRATPPEDLLELGVLVEDSETSSRKRLYEDALQELDHIDEKVRVIHAESALRTTPAQAKSEHPAVTSVYDLRGALLRTLAELRLARWAVLLEGEVAAGHSLADDLHAYEDRFPAGLPLDPYTGRLFRWAKRGEEWLLAVDVDSVDPALLTAGFFCDVDPQDDEALLENDLAWVIGSSEDDR